MIQSIERAILILNAIAAHGGGIGVRELAREIGLKPTTAQNIITTLRAKKFLEFDEDTKRYRVGMGVLRLADAAHPARRMRDFVRPFCEKLFDEIDETLVVLGMLNGQCVSIYSRSSGQALSVREPGLANTRPHVMASGRVLVAHTEPSLQEYYINEIFLTDPLKSTDYTAGKWYSEFSRIRKAGYCITLNVENSGIGAVSVPVFDNAGKIALALAYSVPQSRFDREYRTVLLGKLLDTAKAMQDSFDN